jgi:hypothetical protein
MYRNYQDYCEDFEKMSQEAPECIRVRLKKKDLETFLYFNYQERVEEYLVEEWNLDSFANLAYGNDYSEEIDADDPRFWEKRDEKGDFLYESILDIVDFGRDNKISIPEVAAQVLLFLKKQSVV